MTTDEGAASINRAIIAMARSLNMGTAAEGVETAARLDFLAAAGCDLMQGYFISRPLLAAKITALLGAGLLPVRRAAGGPGPALARPHPLASLHAHGAVQAELALS